MFMRGGVEKRFSILYFLLGIMIWMVSKYGICLLVGGRKVVVFCWMV